LGTWASASENFYKIVVSFEPAAMAMGALMFGMARLESRTLPMAYFVAPLKPGTFSQLLKFLKAAKRTN
jgi:hypothetical protein